MTTIPTTPLPVAMADAGDSTALERLPSELLLGILKNLETARDMSSLACASKELKRRVDSSAAWRDFAQSKFPLLTIPSESVRDWKALARSLTYQSRCWDRRSIRYTGMFGPQQPQTKGLVFQPVVAVDYDIESGREVVVWGAGEDIVARYRKRGATQAQAQQSSADWRQLLGAEHGFRAGVDDVTTMDIVKLPHLKAPAMLAGRDSGDLSLLSLQPDQSFGQLHANLGPQGTTESPKQSTIMSVDVFNDNLVAACTNLGVAIYRLPSDDNTTAIPPIDVYDVLSATTQQAYNAKWMGGDNLLAVALRGTIDPLRYLTVTPTGWTVEAAAKNAQVIEQFDLKQGSILANSLQPVRQFPGMKGPTPLLLSSWKDGTVRLQDIRTPSPFDVVYQDNVQPFSEMGTLMTYGANHFVAGDMQGALIKIFDFRNPRAYYHTTALPCDREYPFRAVEQRFTLPPPDNTNGRACCDHLRGLRCRWHELSRDIYYRPNALFMLSQSLPEYLRQRGQMRVTSLAKASDIAPNFYIGLPGAVVEANLGPIDSQTFDENLGFPDEGAATGSQATAGYATRPMGALMMELGDGLRSLRNTETILMPTVHSRLRTETNLDKIDSMLRKKHRLDKSFHKIEDFGRAVQTVQYPPGTAGLAHLAAGLSLDD